MKPLENIVTMPVMEWVTFKINANCSPDAFIAACEPVNAWARRQPGFLSRAVSVNEEGTWFDVVFWDSVDTAHAAAAKIMGDLGQSDFMAMIDTSTIQMQHPKIVSRS
jgi:hypothetical protein